MMHSVTIAVDYRSEEAEIWPGASPDERLNSQAMMLLIDNIGDANDIFYIHFTCDYATSEITYRSERRPEAITALRHVFGTIAEIRVVAATI